MNVTVTFTDAQLDEIAHRVAAILSQNAPPNTAREHLPVAEAALMAGVAPKTLRNWLYQGKLPRYGTNRHPLVSRADLEALIAPSAPELPDPAPKRPSAGKRRPADPFFADLARSGRASKGKAPR